MMKTMMRFGSADPDADKQIRELLNTISNLQFELAEARNIDVSHDMSRALVTKWREKFPGAGWPDMMTAKELIGAAIEARAPSKAPPNQIPNINERGRE